MELERKDIQGMVVSAYKHLPCAAYLLVQVTDAVKARAWLSGMIAKVTVSENKKSDLSINLAFTFSGLKNLGLKTEVLSTFSFPFQE